MGGLKAKRFPVLMSAQSLAKFEVTEICTRPIVFHFSAFSKNK